MIEKTRATLICADTLRSAKIAVDGKLQSLCPTDLDAQNYVVVPDRSTLDAETAILNVLGGSFNTQVVTFKNLANRLVGTQLNYLNKQNGILMLSRIIQDNADKLTCFDKSFESEGFAEKAYELISAFKYARISPLLLSAEHLPVSVRSKIEDVRLLYQAYVDATQEKFVDSADTLELLLDALDPQTVGNWGFYLYDFLSFTSQEKAVVKKLLQNGRQVTVAAVHGDQKNKNGLCDNAVSLAFKAICEEVGVELAVEYFSAPASPLSQKLYQSFFIRGDGQKQAIGDAVTLAVASSVDGEAKILAEYVDRYVKAGGLYGDVKVVCSDVETYSYAIYKHFADFDIPVYLDEKTVLSDTLPARYLLGWLDCHAYQMQLEKVLDFGKNPLAQLSLSAFETFCKKYNVNYRLESFDIGLGDPLFEEADQARQKLFGLLCSREVPRYATARCYVEVVREVAEQHQLATRVEEYLLLLRDLGLEGQARALEQSLKKIEGVLLQVEGILGDANMPLEKFILALTASLSSQTVAVLPAMRDCVFVSNLDKGKNHDVKVLAVLGANEGELPKLYKSCALLSDKNLKELEKIGLSPEISLAQKNRQERFALYNLLCEPQDKLLVTYKLRHGKEDARPSSVVATLKNAFDLQTVGEGSLSVSKKTLQEQAVNAYALQKEGVPLQESQLASLHCFSDEVGRFDLFDCSIPQIADGEKVFFRGDTFSATRIEKFFQCPFACFLKNGVELIEEEEPTLKSSDFGNVLHAVFDGFIKILKNNPDVNQKTAEKVFDEVMQEERYKAIARTYKGKAFCKKLKKEAVAHCMTIKKEVENSCFHPQETEFYFGKTNGCPTLKVNGKQMYLKGFIDRIDVLDDKALIFDYKTGSPSFSLSELYGGTKLQLFLYSIAVKEALKKEAIGSVYYKVIPLSAPDKSGKIKGRIINDRETLLKIDRKIASSSPDGLLGAVLTKKGEINKKLSVFVDKREFEDCQVYATAIIGKACQLMIEGYAEVNPLEYACEYCKAKGLCGFNDTRVKPHRKVPSVSTGDIARIASEIKAQRQAEQALQAEQAGQGAQEVANEQ